MLVAKIVELSFYQVTTRLARLIDNLTDDELQGDSQDRLTRDEMAARLGTVREVVVRSLKELDRGAAVRVYRRKIEVINRRLLQAGLKHQKGRHAHHKSARRAHLINIWYCGFIKRWGRSSLGCLLLKDIKYNHDHRPQHEY